MAASGSTGSPNFLPYPLDTDPVDVAGDIELLALQTSGRLNVKIDNVTTTLGDTIYTSANGTPGTIARLAGNTSATRAFLGQTGTGTVSAAPSWTLSTGTGNVVLNTSPTITTPTILDILATTTATADLWSEVTTGSITIGAGLTTGTLNIAAAGTGATTINLGHTNATLNIVGTIDIPIVSAVALGTNASGVIAAASTSGTGSTILLQGTPTITTPVIDSISASGVAATASLWSNITTGSITEGSGLTSGTYSLANGTTFAGTINIASGVTTAGTKTINLGATGGAGSTTTITIGSTTGTSTTTVLGTFRVGVTTLAQGVNGTVTLPATAGTLALNPTTTIGDIIYASATGTPGTLARLAGNTATQTAFLASTGNGTANTTTSFISSTGTAGSNVVLATSPTITSPTIDNIINTSVSTAATYFNGITTGSITTGNALTTGSFNIANGTAIAGGSVNIASGAGTGNKTVAIGTSATAGTTAITIGSNSGATSTIALNGTVTVGGDMTINGTLTTINSNSLNIDDKNIELGAVTAGTISATGTVGSISGTGPWTATITGMTDTADLIPGSAITATNGTGSLGSGGTYIVSSVVNNTSITYVATGGTTPTAGTVTNITTTGATDVTANGGGVILKGTTDKTILWDSTNSNWTSSEHLNLVSGKVFKINNVQVLSNTAVLGITPTTNATGFTLSGGTTAVAVTFAGGAAYTISGTNGQTYTMPSSGGTLSLNPTTTIGDIIYASATGTPGTLARLAGNTATQPSFLTSTGNGTANTTTSFTSSTGSGNVVLATSATLTTPVIDTIVASGATATAALWNTVITTGSISIGGALTTGTLNLATGGTGATNINVGHTNALIGIIGNTTVTGTVTGNSFIPTSSTVPTNGMYLSAANTLNFATNTTGNRLVISSAGDIGIGAAAVAGYTLDVRKNITGITDSKGIVSRGVIQSDVTSSADYYNTFAATAAASFSLTNLTHYYANQGTFGAGSAVTNQYGFSVSSALIGATNNYGFISSIPAAANRWNFYANGTAANYFAGQTTINSTSLVLGNNGTANSTAQQFGVVAGTAGTVGLVVRAAASPTAHIQEWQDSSGNILARIASTGQLLAPSIVSSNFQITSGGVLSVGTSTAIANTQAYIIPTAIGNNGLVIRGASGQTANLQEWQTNTPSTVTWVDQNAILNTTNTPTSNNQVANKLYVDNAVAAASGSADVVPLDDISNYFDGTETRFVPAYQGTQVSILNPLSLLLTINGIIQYVNTPEYVWMSGLPQRGFFVDSDGQLQFSEAVPAGSEFDARIMSGNVATTRTRVYPFKPLDILLGG